MCPWYSAYCFCESESYQVVIVQKHVPALVLPARALQTRPQESPRKSASSAGRQRIAFHKSKQMLCPSTSLVWCFSPEIISLHRVPHTKHSRMLSSTFHWALIRELLSLHVFCHSESVHDMIYSKACFGPEAISLFYPKHKPCGVISSR